MKQIRFTLLLSLLLSMAHMNVFAGNIVFADANVKAICVANWDTNHDGELSEAEAAAVMSLGEVFKGNTEITSFDELQYFTGLTSINDEAFMGSSICSVVFPNNITSIGNCAFAGCDDLGRIILPEGVVNIGSSAFAGLSGDQSHHEYAHSYVYFPSTIKTVGENAFWRGVEKVEIADLAAWCGIDFQGSYANPMSYNGCIIVNGKEVTDLVIPEGITSIGPCAFIQIPGFNPDGNYIQSVKLPSTLVTIGNGAFGRSRISGIDIPSSVKTIGSNAFAESSLGSVTLHEGLETIEGSAFYDCDGLTSIDIPAGVTISEGAFSDCDNLTSVRVREGEPSEMDVVSTFSNCANATLYTPGLSLRKEGGSHNFIDSHQAYMDNWPGFKEYVAIEEDDDYFNLDELGCLMRVISAEQSTAEIAVFWPVEGGVSVSGTFNVPSTVASGQSGKVYTITTINRDSGFDYSMMSSNFDLKLPSSITYIKSGALPGNAFRSITVDAANPVYDSRDNCNAVIKTATNELIAGCFNTTIPESVTAIGEAAFADITSLKEITIPASVASIDRYAFWGCESLTSMTVEWAEPITSTSEISDWFPSCFNATLYVPYGTKAAYEAAPYWGNFKEIIEYGAPEKYTVTVNGDIGVNLDESRFSEIQSDDPHMFGTSAEFNAGSRILISASCYGAFYIQDIIVNGNSVVDWEENTAPSVYVYQIESLSENTTVEVKPYLRTDYRTLGCVAEGPGKVEMYKNGQYVGTTSTQNSYNTSLNLITAVYEYGDVMKLVFVPDAGSTLTSFVGGEHYGYEEHDLFREISDNSYSITFDPDEWFSGTLERSYVARFEGPEPSTNNTLSASVPTLLTGKSSTMSLSLTNEDVIIACEFDLQLPNGITLAKDDDGDVIRTLGSRASKHVLEVSDRGNGIYHFLCYSNTNKVFTGNDGELLSVEFVCDESMAEGTYEATVKNIILSDPDLKKITLADYTFGVEVINADPGDVNNDGDINVMDVVQTVAYIMGNGTADFIFGAADMDNDGSINVVDLVRIVSMIMSSSAAAPAQPWTDNSLLLNTRADGTIAVGVNTDIPYVASEFIVEVGSGQSLEDVTTDKQHRAAFVPVDDTHFKVMTYSSSNQQFADTDAMLTLHVSGEGLVTVRDAMLVDEDYKGVTFAPTSGGYTTGIMQMENGKLIIENSSVYDLQGRKHDTLQPFKHEVLIVNGKKQVVK